MKCKDYIFELTSGRLQESGWLLQAQCAAHRMICVHCRAFTRNDREILDALKLQRDRIVQDMHLGDEQ